MHTHTETGTWQVWFLSLVWSVSNSELEVLPWCSWLLSQWGACLLVVLGDLPHTWFSGTFIGSIADSSNSRASSLPEDCCNASQAAKLEATQGIAQRLEIRPNAMSALSRGAAICPVKPLSHFTCIFLPIAVKSALLNGSNSINLTESAIAPHVGFLLQVMKPEALNVWATASHRSDLPLSERIPGPTALLISERQSQGRRCWPWSLLREGRASQN